MRRKINPVIMLSVSAALLIVWAAFLRPINQSLKVGARQNAELKAQLAAADEQIEMLQNAVQSKIQNITLDGERILSEISAASENFNLSIEKLKVGEITSRGGLKTLTVQLEVRGYLSNICGFFNLVCPQDSGISINGFSLRRSGSLPWLARKTDDEIPLDWWTDAEDTQDSEPQYSELSDLIGSGEMRCFAEITFTGGA